MERIGLAVHEIMINAVVHGNGCNPHKKVVVTFSRTPDKLKIVIAEEGKGFDPDHLPIPLVQKAFYEVLAGVSTWRARLWTNSMCNTIVRAGLR